MTTTGIEMTLQALTSRSWHNRLDPAVHKMARELTDRESTRQQKMEAIVDSLHRRFQLARTDASEEETLASPAQLLVAQRAPMDADDACAVVASLAMSVGIRCRFVAARYGRSWTCWVSYEVGDHWETIDPFRQRPDREPDEQVLGPLPDERRPYMPPTLTQLSADDPRVQRALRERR